MFLLDVIRSIRGTVRFTVSGDFAPRFVNLAAREQIPLWDYQKRGDHFTAAANAGDYKKLRPLAKKAGVRIRLIEKTGAAFTRHRYRRRWGLVLGIVVFLAFLSAMSLFLWRIEVNGLETLPASRVLDALGELGIRPGSFRAGVDVRACEQRTLLKVPELAWIAINIDGSTVTVEVSERDPPPAVIDAHAPCNVVAAKSGQILSMNIFEGQAMVSPGQAVLEGDILISGVTQDKLGKNLFRHARGEVLARLTHRIAFEVPLEQTRYLETGEMTERGYLELFGLTLPLFLPGEIKGYYRTEQPPPVLPFGAGLPVSLRTQRYVMMRPESHRLTEPEAKSLAARELTAIEAVDLAGAEILERAVTASLGGDSYTMRADYVCVMDICEEREILISAD